MHNSDSSGKAPYEMTDANAFGIVVVGVVLTATALISGVIGLYIVKWGEQRPAMTEFEKSPLAAEHEDWTTETRLQSDPGVELQKHLHEQRNRLHSYGSVSERPAIYRIPIETAIDIIAHDGKFPEFQAVDATTQGTQH